MRAAVLDIPTERLPAYALFAALLAAAGLPLYIHAPKFFVDQYGVSLAAMGTVLFGLRLLDVVQDPLLGRLAARLGDRRSVAVGVAVAVIGSAMVGLFAVVPPIDPLIWFAVMLALVFSTFSFLTIVFYARGVAKADTLGQSGHLRLARWRETGALLGVCGAAVAPAVLAGVTDQPLAVFAFGFGALAFIAAISMRPEWGEARIAPASGFSTVLRDPLSRRLLVIACLNAAPVAVSSTLFLYFVESRLSAPGMEGPLLLVFFLSAAAAAPIWGHLAERVGVKPALLSAMLLAVGAFGFALLLGAGDWPAFAVICVLSGAAVGADLTLLPAIFAKRMGQISPGGAEGFGLWSFVSKVTLAFAAVLLLPTLEAAGFVAGGENTQSALTVLTLFYAGIPCVLKLVAIALLAVTKLEEI
jgi:GPH family glycoside/pentoside/hexuronide:cation symporter